MISRWANQKPAAIELRRRGNSIKDIEKALGIPRSTLSGWLRTVPLTKKHRASLERRAKQALVKARGEAVKWHNSQKAVRMQIAAAAASDFLKRIPNTVDTLELALAFLYLGEGSKTSQTAMGSSNPCIAIFFVRCLQRIYSVPTESIRCYLHLRADQDIEKMEQYWSAQLNLPRSNFGKASIDVRTKGRPTYSNYKGVCLIVCGKVEIQRRLMYIASGFCGSRV